MERVVSRSELISEDESSLRSSPDPRQLNALNGFDLVKRNVEKHPQHSETNEDEELEFVLFAPKASNGVRSQGVAKIRVQTPPPVDAEPGFIVPARHESYYFTRSPNSDAKDDIEFAAISGQDVILRAQSHWPGSSYNWKVLHISSIKKQSSMLCNTTTGFSKLIDKCDNPKRKRPGKQSRLKTRTKMAAKKAQQEQRQKDAELKEAAEREKRTRRNREKKVKKKQRDKAKKVGPGVEADANEDTDSPD